MTARGVARRGIGLAFLLFASFVFVAPSARAQGALDAGGMDLHLFRPSVDSKGFLSVNGTDILGAGSISFGLVLDVGLGILPTDNFILENDRVAADAKGNDRIIDTFFTGTLNFNYGIANALAVGLAVPVQVIGGKNSSVPGVYNSLGDGGPSYQGLGNLQLHGKLRMTRVERDGIGLAALVRVELPTGTTEKFAGEPGVALWPELVAEYRPIPQIRFGLNAGYRFNSGKGAKNFPVDGRVFPTGTNATMPMLDAANAGTSIDYDDLITFGLAASFRVAPAWDIVLEGYGSQLISSFNKAGMSLEALGGIKIFVERNSYLMLAAGPGIPTGGFETADFRGVVGFVFEPSIGDRDGDGYKDDADQCPDEPEDFDNFADEDGCPDPDNDRDGILDVDDECPLVPEDRDGDADEDGCPEGNEGDRDGDGIMDSVDQCPDDPEDKDGFQDEDGCPDPDNDQDGILDVDDLCPNDPEDKDNFQDEDGCPDPDNDQDRILDVNDSCPNDPETYNGFEDEDGCPDRGSVIIEDNQIVILEKIYFETDSAVIQQRSYPIIDAVAATLNGNPHITKIEVQGHADERSADDYNIRLTRDRAASVVEALVSRGVAVDRVRSGGYGERCPVDPRHNAEAWEKNRRVEFKILQTESGPTGVEVACPAGRELIPADK